MLKECPIETEIQVQALDATQQREPIKIGIFEQIIAGLIFIFPMMGVFMPVEEYFSVETVHNIHNALYAPIVDYSISSDIHILTLLILSVLTFFNWRGMVRQAKNMLPLLVLLGWIFASAIWSIDSNNTLHRAFHVVDRVVFSVYLVHRFGWDGLVKFLTRMYAIITLISLFMVIAFPLYGFSDLNGYADAWRGAFTQKNTLGSLALIGTVISGCSLFYGLNRRWFAFCVCGGQFLLLVMSRSATSLAAFSIVLLLTTVLFMFSRHQNPFLRIAAFAVMLATVAGSAILLSQYDSINEIMGRSSDMTGRTIIWHNVLKTIQLRPLLGFGYGFWVASSIERLNMWTAMGWPMPHAHDEWLDVTLQLGILGLGLEVYCLALCLVRAVRCSSNVEQGKVWCCGLIIVILCALSYTETVLTDPAINAWTWLVIAFLVLAESAEERKRTVVYSAPALQGAAGR